MGALTFAGLATLFSSLMSKRKSFSDFGENRSLKARARLAPLFAGLGFPLSLLLEIPVLTYHWSNNHEFSQEIVLNIGLVISLVLGVTANLSLISRYFEHHVQLSTLMAIGTLTFHDIINITLLIYLGVKDFAHNYPKTGWMLFASTIISVGCNIALLVDYIYVENFRAKGSGLTTKQRTLIVVTMALLLYCGLGAMFFILLEKEQLDFSAAVYFSICTITTVGFGDITPTTTASRIYVFFFAIIGIILLAIAISTTHETIAEIFEALYRSRRDRIVEKIRKRTSSRRENGSQSRISESAWQSVASVDINQNNATNTPQSDSGQPSSRSLGKFFGFGRSRSPKDESQANSESNPSFGHLMRSYKDFQKVLTKQENKEFQKKLITSLIVFCCFWLLGGVVFKFTEGWSYGDSLYFGYTSFLTLGYGDLKVTTSVGRAFFVAWLLFGIANMTLLLSVLTEAWRVKYKYAIGKRRRKNFFLRNRTLSRYATDVETGNQAGGEVGIQPRSESQSSPSEFEDTMQRLVKTAKSFSTHARYWMNGKTGDPPAELVMLMAEVENMERTENINDPGGFIEQIVSMERQKELFLISFAKTFELLTDIAAESSTMYKENMRELEMLRKLHDRCQCKPRVHLFRDVVPSSSSFSPSGYGSPNEDEYPGDPASSNSVNNSCHHCQTSTILGPELIGDSEKLIKEIDQSRYQSHYETSEKTEPNHSTTTTEYGNRREEECTEDLSPSANLPSVSFAPPGQLTSLSSNIRPSFFSRDKSSLAREISSRRENDQDIVEEKEDTPPELKNSEGQKGGSNRPNLELISKTHQIKR